ncbi:MAG: CTP synthase [Aigarchaeota archaeon]|nr:CTP synthase [Aigarchaeota archaeon]MDW8092943.1 CTP synthase [Nitrososphaerota archaeon]
MPKYIFVTGGVVSSVGKGAVAASIGKLLHWRGYGVDFLKIDPYVNVDAGTLNPYSHGEVFVTDDGGETDLDLGWYERFLDVPMSRHNNLTTGQVYLEVINQEREGKFLGQCVQIIPHITNEIKRRIRSVAARSGADFVIVEIGGTAGDIEGQPFYEAARQMKLEEETLFVHVALLVFLEATMEFKTKALQHSINELRRIGIQPDIVIARSKKMIDDQTRSKIALFSTLPKDAVFCSLDVETIYELPLVLEEQGLGDYISKRFNLRNEKTSISEWKWIVSRFKEAKHLVKIGVCGKYTSLTDSYVSIREALKHAGAFNDTKVEIVWIDVEEFERDEDKISVLKSLDGILVPGGFGKRGSEGKLKAIRFARESRIPYLGICFGLQLAVIEFARNVLGLEGANSVEIEPETEHPVVTAIPEQTEVRAMGGTMRLGSQPVKVIENTLAHSLYGSNLVYERHRHRFEVNPEYWGALTKGGLVFSGFSLDGRRVEIIELKDHPFFIAGQFHPEYKSRPGRPSPLFNGFIIAALNQKLEQAKTIH